MSFSATLIGLVIAAHAGSQKTIRRLVALGHELGNYTSHLNHLPSLTPEGVRSEGAILMHSNYRTTSEAMPILVQAFKERGYTNVTVEQLHARYLEHCSR